MDNSLFGNSSFYKKAGKLAWPVMLQVFVQSLVSLIDNFMVAGLGDVKMSSVTISNQLIFVFLVTASTLAVASGIFMSQYNGKGDKKGMQDTFRFKMFSLFILSVTIFIIIKLFSTPLLMLLLNGNSSANTVGSYGRDYLTLVIWSILPMAISYSIGSGLREIGTVKPPLYFGLVATLANTILNYLLIYGKFGFPRLEVKGAAIATVIARTVSALLFLFYYYKYKPKFFVYFRTLFYQNKSLAKNILKGSFNLVLCDVSWVITTTIIIALYNSRGGSDLMAGMGAAFAISNLFFVIFPVVEVPIGVIVGGSLGNNKFEKAKKEAKWIFSGGFVLALISASLLALLAKPIVSFVYYNLSNESHLVATHLLYIMSFFMLVWIVLNIQLGIAKAGGDTWMGAWVETLVNLFIALPLMYFLTKYTNINPVLLYGIVKTTEFIKLILYTIELKKEKWINNLT